jgi:CheY-like chemotaxis protein
LGFSARIFRRSLTFDSRSRHKRLDGFDVKMSLSSPSPFVPRSTPISVVVADDVAEIQNLLQHWLSELGFLVTCVSSGEEAIRVLRMVHVDMVITDILMPDGDGLEVITQLRKLQPTARIIAMSGGGSHLRAADCLKYAVRLGAHSVLMKPFDRQQLIDVVSRQLSPGPSEKPA